MSSSGAALLYGQTFLAAPTGNTALDTAALAAVAGPAGIYRMQPGTYSISGVITVGDGRDLVGSGGGFGTPQTVLKCTGANDQLLFTGGGGVSQGWKVDGNNVANIPLVIGGGLHAAGRTFISFGAANAVLDCCQMLGAQNYTIIEMSLSNSGRDLLYIDQGFGGAELIRCELNTSGRYHVNIDAVVAGGPYAKPSDLHFRGGILEGTVGGASVIKVTSGFNINFTETAIYVANPAGMSTPLIDAGTACQDLTLNGVWVANGPGTTPVAGSVGVIARGVGSVAVTGRSIWQNLETVWQVDGASSFIYTLGWAELYNCTQLTPGINGGAAGQIGSYTSAGINTNTANGSDLSLVFQRPARDGYRFAISSAGNLKWYTGNSGNFTADAQLLRRASGCVGTPSGTQQIIATGSGTTAQRPAPAGAAAGAFYFDTTLGKPIFVNAAGTGWVDATGAAV